MLTLLTMLTMLTMLTLLTTISIDIVEQSVTIILMDSVVILQSQKRDLINELISNMVLRDASASKNA